jgi:hypothetical protein
VSKSGFNTTKAKHSGDLQQHGGGWGETARECGWRLSGDGDKGIIFCKKRGKTSFAGGRRGRGKGAMHDPVEGMQ